MGIAAVLMILSLSAYINARNQAMVSDTTEQILSTLREAQNRAISVTNGVGTNKATHDTKAWGVLFTNNTDNVYLMYWDALKGTSTGIVPGMQGGPKKNNNISVKTSYNGASDSGWRFIVYSSPFAKSYTMTSYSTSFFEWQQRVNSPTQDWAPIGGVIGFTNPLIKDEVRVVVSYNGRFTQTVVINRQGDSYIE